MEHVRKQNIISNSNEKKARPSLKNFDNKLFPCGGLVAKTLTEISGGESTGKRLLLYQLIAKCLPPIEFGGRACGVVLCDLSNKFDARVLMTYIRRVIVESGDASVSSLAPAELDGIVQNCLKYIYIFHCYTPTQYTIALHAAENLIKNNHAISLLAIDSIEAFYWLETYENQMRMSTHYASNLTRLKELFGSYDICCAYTVSEHYIASAASDSAEDTHAELPKPDIAYKLTLYRDENGNRKLNDCSIAIDSTGIRLCSANLSVNRIGQ